MTTTTEYTPVVYLSCTAGCAKPERMDEQTYNYATKNEREPLECVQCYAARMIVTNRDTIKNTTGGAA